MLATRCMNAATVSTTVLPGGRTASALRQAASRSFLWQVTGNWRAKQIPLHQGGQWLFNTPEQSLNGIFGSVEEPLPVLIA
jgi:hypothetical protein